MYLAHRHVALNHFPVFGTNYATVIIFAIASLAVITNCIAGFIANQSGRIDEESETKKEGKSKKLKPVTH